MKKYELDTPSLVLDIDRFDYNLRVMRDLASSHGKKLRPHAKTHKCPEIARRQISAGNCAGICAAKVSEAKALIDEGIRSVLITSPVVTAQKIANLMQLNSMSDDLMAVVENPENIRALALAAKDTGKPLQVLVDIDPHMGRTGVSFGNALETGKYAASFPFLKLRGIQCYAGHLQHVLSYEERKAASLSEMRQAVKICKAFRESGLCCDVFTGTGTGTSDVDLTIPEMTDIQVGSYCLMDAEYGAVGVGQTTFSDFYRPALTMLSSVISTNQDGFVTIDAGTKSLYMTPHAPPRIVGRNGEILPGWEYSWSFGDEHGRLKYSGRKPVIGDVVELIVSHCDPTVNLFDAIHVCRGDEVIDCWKISLRGCNR